jgi:O-antigen ligase
LNTFTLLIGIEPAPSQIGFTLINCLYLSYLLAVRSVRRGRTLPQDAGPLKVFGAASKIALVFLVWAGISVLWAPNASTATMFYLGNIVPVVVVYLLCKMASPLLVFRNACIGSAYAAVFSIPLALLLTGYSGGRLGLTSEGLFVISPIAFSACIGVMSVAYLAQTGRFTRPLTILFSSLLLVELYLTFAKTEMISLVAAIAVYILFSNASGWQRVRRIVGMAVGLAIALVALAPKIADYLGGSEIQGADTLTGRTVLWAETILQVVHGPWLKGYGLMAFSRIGPIPFHGAEHLVHAHNEFVTTWFNLGLIGVFLLFSAYVALGVNSAAVIRKSDTIAAITLCAVIFCLARGIAEANSLLSVLPIQWLVLMDAAVRSEANFHRGGVGRVHGKIAFSYMGRRRGPALAL